MKKNASKIGAMVFMAAITTGTIGHYVELWAIVYPLGAFLGLLTTIVMDD